MRELDCCVILSEHDGAGRCPYCGLPVEWTLGPNVYLIAHVVEHRRPTPLCVACASSLAYLLMTTCMEFRASNQEHFATLWTPEVGPFYDDDDPARD